MLGLGATASRGQSNPDFPQTQSQQYGSGQAQNQGNEDFPQVHSAEYESMAAPPVQGGGAPSVPGSRGDDRSMNGGPGKTKKRHEDGARGDGTMDGDSHGDGSGDDDRSGSMDLDGAGVNFATVVESYVAKKSSAGYWTYKEKKNGKPAKSWRLAHPEVDSGSIKGRGRGRYSGRVKLIDARYKRALTLEFLVDFSGNDWKVVSVTPSLPAVSSRR